MTAPLLKVLYFLPCLIDVYMYNRSESHNILEIVLLRHVSCHARLQCYLQQEKRHMHILAAFCMDAVLLLIMIFNLPHDHTYNTI